MRQGSFVADAPLDDMGSDFCRWTVIATVTVTVADTETYCRRQMLRQLLQILYLCIKESTSNCHSELVEESLPKEFSVGYFDAVGYTLNSSLAERSAKRTAGRRDTRNKSCFYLRDMPCRELFRL